jgi:hypothetical protein
MKIKSNPQEWWAAMVLVALIAVFLYLDFCAFSGFLDKVSLPH